MSGKTLTHREAWADFWEVVKPRIWAALSRKERRVLHVAQQDYDGKRRDRHGKTVSLGDQRIEGLLDRFGGGRYVFKREVWVEVVE